MTTKYILIGCIECCSSLQFNTIFYTAFLPIFLLPGIPCERVFIAHYEHVLSNPSDYIEPLTDFLELNTLQKEALRKRLSKKGKSLVSRKTHKLTQYKECNEKGQLNEKNCYRHITQILDEFFIDRSFMWPTFAGNGFNVL